MRTSQYSGGRPPRAAGNDSEVHSRMTLIKGRLPLPGTSLLNRGETGTLAIDQRSFTHLMNYVTLVERLPADFDAGSSAMGEAVDGLRAAVRQFGSPHALRRLLVEQPNALADEDASPFLYARIVAVIQRLHESASGVVSILQSLPASAGRDGDVTAGLRLLGSRADNARVPVGPLTEGLKAFKAEILLPNSKLSAAARADAEAVRQLQEAVGRLRVRVQGQQTQLDQLGTFTMPQKRSGIAEQLHQLQRELAATSALAAKRRAALGHLEPIVEAGGWLERGLDDVIEFLENLRKVWTAFGSGVMQLAADFSGDDRAGAAWAEQRVDVEEAVKQWNAIDRAATEFVAASTVDVPDDATLLRGTT